MADIFNDIEATNRSIEIVHPKTKEPIGLRVDIVSFSDDRLKPLKRKLMDQQLSNASRNKTFKAEEVEENGMNVTINAMLDWTWHKDANGEETTYKGEKPEFNRRNIKMVLTERPWIMDQIDDACRDEAAFYAQSKTS